MPYLLNTAPHSAGGLQSRGPPHFSLVSNVYRDIRQSCSRQEGKNAGLGTMSTESMSRDRPDILNTVNLVTQCLCIPIVTLFVGLRFGIRGWYRQWAGAEDCMFAFYSCKLQEYTVLMGASRDMFRRVGKYTISRLPCSVNQPRSCSWATAPLPLLVRTSLPPPTYCHYHQAHPNITQSASTVAVTTTPTSPRLI